MIHLRFIICNYHFMWRLTSLPNRGNILYFYPCGEPDAVEALLVGVEEDVVVGANLELEVSLKMWIIADKQMHI